MAASVAGDRPSSPSLRQLVDFYDPVTRGPDARGRTLDEILSWSDERLEAQHNYIQTVFPLPEGSDFSFAAPVVDEETMLLFARSAALQGNLLRALKRMLAFYGFDAVEDGEEGPGPRLVITPRDDDCAPGFARWVKRLDHNHLRITRIIRSLRVLGLAAVARDFYNALIEVYRARGKIGPNSIAFWTRAVEEPLRYAPDGTEVHWLKNY
ncbi:hypothetical protein F4802DRAFT_566107 [Xylaria palmicola]|nr:hypothetical protein F4802DRAFT_566107 [Xylaria palmicola]